MLRLLRLARRTHFLLLKSSRSCSNRGFHFLTVFSSHVKTWRILWWMGLGNSCPKCKCLCPCSQPCQHSYSLAAARVTLHDFSVLYVTHLPIILHSCMVHLQSMRPPSRMALLPNLANVSHSDKLHFTRHAMALLCTYCGRSHVIWACDVWMSRRSREWVHFEIVLVPQFTQTGCL